MVMCYHQTPAEVIGPTDSDEQRQKEKETEFKNTIVIVVK